MTLILLDIDGPLNVAGGAQDDGFAPLGGGWNKGIFDVKTLRSRFTHIRFGYPDVQFVWATAWGNDAHGLERSLGLPQGLPVIPLQDYVDITTPGRTWKLNTVRKWLADNGYEDEPLVWLDDELEYDAYQWARRRRRAAETLLVRCSTVRGWSNAEYRNVLDFCQANKREGQK